MRVVALRPRIDIRRMEGNSEPGFASGKRQQNLPILGWSYVPVKDETSCTPALRLNIGLELKLHDYELECRDFGPLGQTSFVW
jgi:hypothetical protein